MNGWIQSREGYTILYSKLRLLAVRGEKVTVVQAKED
jgi:hypothetical protein